MRALWMGRVLVGTLVVAMSGQARGGASGLEALIEGYLDALDGRLALEPMGRFNDTARVRYRDLCAREDAAAGPILDLASAGDDVAAIVTG